MSQLHCMFLLLMFVFWIVRCWFWKLKTLRFDFLSGFFLSKDNILDAYKWSSISFMAKIKPQALLQQSKKKKGPRNISVTTVVLYGVLLVLLVFFLLASYRHFTQRFVNPFFNSNFFFLMFKFWGFSSFQTNSKLAQSYRMVLPQVVWIFFSNNLECMCIYICLSTPKHIII